MARYQRTLPIVDSQENTFAKIHKLLTGKRYRYETNDGQQMFRKGDGFWTLAKFIKITYAGNFVRVEAWVDSTGNEMDLEGFAGSAGKKPLKKMVAQVEEILSQPGENFTPREDASLGPEFPEEKQILPVGITKREYLKNYAGDMFQRQLKGAAIFGYVCTGINLIYALLFHYAALLDMVILLGLTLGMHLGKSKGCAVGMLVYAIASMVINFVLYGIFGGWMLLIVGILAVQVFGRAEKRYQKLTVLKPVGAYTRKYTK